MRRRAGWRWWSRTCRRSRRPCPRSARARASARRSRRSPASSSRRGSTRSTRRRSSRTRRRATSTSPASTSRAAPRARSSARCVREASPNFPWPKSMRFGAARRRRRAALVRPLHSIVLLLDGKVVPFEIAGVEAGKETRGHRFHGNEPFKVTGFADYDEGAQSSTRSSSIPRRAQRRSPSRRARSPRSTSWRWSRTRRCSPRTPASPSGRPVLMGEFDEAFLEVPAECLTTVDEDAPEVLLAARIRVEEARRTTSCWSSNLNAKDGGTTDRRRQREGDRARGLSDAKFFWEQDLKKRSRACATS